MLCLMMKTETAVKPAAIYTKSTAAVMVIYIPSGSSADLSMVRKYTLPLMVIRIIKPVTIEPERTTKKPTTSIMVNVNRKV